MAYGFMLFEIYTLAVFFWIIVLATGWLFKAIAFGCTVLLSTLLVQLFTSQIRLERTLALRDEKLGRLSKFNLLSQEMCVPLYEEERYALLEGKLSEFELIQILQHRNVQIWSNLNKDCRFWSKSEHLKCATNPTASCTTCEKFEQG